jgi:hypothetical protein
VRLIVAVGAGMDSMVGSAPLNVLSVDVEVFILLDVVLDGAFEVNICYTASWEEDSRSG